jgi:outer membrane protein assembly factor BamA
MKTNSRPIQRRRSGMGAVLGALLTGVVALVMVTGAGADVLRRVERVRVEGIRIVSEESVVGWTRVREGAVWSERLDRSAVERVLKGYRERGYWNVRVETKITDRRSDRVVVTYRVREGEVTSIGSVAFSGALPGSVTQVQSLVDLQAGDPLKRAHIASDANTLMDFFERTGYPFATVTPEVSVRPGDTRVNLVWAIEAGPRVSIDGVRFTGRRTTQAEVLLRETGLSVGQPYDQRQIDESTNALRRLTWLTSVADPVIEQDAASGRYLLNYAVEEASATTIEGGVGLLPGPEGQYNWVGRVNFASDNLGGSGRGAHFLWDRPEPRSSDLQVTYSEPWLLGQPFHGSAGVTFEQRPGYVEAGIDGGLGYRPAADTEVSVAVERTSVRPDSVGGPTVGRQSIWSVGAEIEWDTRDSRRLPRTGWSVTAAGMWDRVSDAAASDFARLRYRLGLETYRPLNRRTVVSVRLQGEGLFQDESPGPNALVRVGGAQTIRGYVEEHFLVEHALWSSVQLMRDLGRGARVYLFGDSGVLKSIRSSDTGWVKAMGYGVGLQSQVRTGTMMVEYGLSKDDSPGQGKIHVKMIGAF